MKDMLEQTNKQFKIWVERTAPECTQLHNAPSIILLKTKYKEKIPVVNIAQVIYMQNQLSCLTFHQV